MSLNIGALRTEQKRAMQIAESADRGGTQLHNQLKQALDAVEEVHAELTRAQKAADLLNEELEQVKEERDQLLVKVEKMRLNCSCAGKKIRVSGDLLVGAMRLLTRAQLDVMPLVGQSFRHHYLVASAIPTDTLQQEVGRVKRRSSPFLPQCRLIGDISLGEHDLYSFCRISPLPGVVAEYPRVFSRLKKEVYGNSYELSEEGFASMQTFSQDFANVRAKCTTLWVYGNNNYAALSKATLFESLWDGCKVKLLLDSDAMARFDFSALPDLSRCREFGMCGPSIQVIQWAVPLNEPALLCCQAIDCRNFIEAREETSFDRIADYLVVSGSTTAATNKAKAQGLHEKSVARRLALRLNIPGGTLLNMHPAD